jgi:hypothetical protein
MNMSRGRFVNVELRVPKDIAIFYKNEPELVVEVLETYAKNELERLAQANRPRPAKVPVLLEAEELIGGQRLADYGDQLTNFSHIAMFWNALLAPKLRRGFNITAEDVALGMMGVKMARLAKTPDHYDSILDIAGYSGCYDKLQQARRRGSGYLVGNIIDYRANLSRQDVGMVDGSKQADKVSK